ncbi:hypothetical protein [Streptomyces sp. NPDC001480]|uniref:hypothetical protein n=1 Tax=Streptomyces sp. NPDC001480 TaxID=3364577 RepID=UPI003694A048
MPRCTPTGLSPVAEVCRPSEQGAIAGPQRNADAALNHTEWTPPANESTPDADRAWWDLNAVCLVVLGPDADNHLADFIASQYADKAGALVIACLLHLADDGSGARFWWRFAAGTVPLPQPALVDRLRTLTSPL